MSVLHMWKRGYSIPCISSKICSEQEHRKAEHIPSWQFQFLWHWPSISLLSFHVWTRYVWGWVDLLCIQELFLIWLLGPMTWIFNIYCPRTMIYQQVWTKSVGWFGCDCVYKNDFKFGSCDLWPMTFNRHHPWPLSIILPIMKIIC